LVGALTRGEPTEGRATLREAFKRLEQETPDRIGRAARWLRHPNSRWVRLPVGVLLIAGGVFSFLPVLGIWMLPLGLLLLAIDVTVLQKPVGRFTLGALARWSRLRESWAARKSSR
jgi:hypothetical protein